MSSPRNPLEQRSGHATYFVIEAFKDTQKAESSAGDISLEHGPEGAVFNDGVVIVNDAIEKDKAPTKFLVKDLQFNFEWVGNYVNTTISGGSLILQDTSGGEFLSFLRQDVINRLSTSLENLTFVLKAFWINDALDKDEMIVSEPLFFSIAQIEHKVTGNQHFYDCDVVPLFNTRAGYNTYNRLYSMTVTHASGNLHEEIPAPESADGGIKTRQEEDADKTESRKTRIDKSKPMTNLGDAFKALEKELNESTKIHKGQLQEWQKVIRSGFTEKIKTPTQEKDIPIKYKITLENGYASYDIDNRNLPFEQPEQRQNKPGIRSIPTVYGESIETVVDRIMRLSKKTGEDARLFTPKDYKICKVWQRIGDEIHYDIVIKKYTVPYNQSEGKNTGPGEGAVDPLTFYYKVQDEDFDVLMFDGILHRSDELTVVEKSADSEASRLSFGADREAITAEREVNTDFFKTGYSGNRTKITNQKTLGVEYPRELASTIRKKYPLQNTQQSAINITIPGNPYLLSDLFRKPSEAASGSHKGALVYKRAEVLPMYAKLLVEFVPVQEGDTPVTNRFYHTNWMHIYKVQSIFKNGAFFQRITLLRTDDMV